VGSHRRHRRNTGGKPQETQKKYGWEATEETQKKHGGDRPQEKHRRNTGGEATGEAQNDTELV
jgi:hypothetical protein